LWKKRKKEPFNVCTAQKVKEGPSGEPIQEWAPKKKKGTRRGGNLEYASKEGGALVHVEEGTLLMEKKGREKKKRSGRSTKR